MIKMNIYNTRIRPNAERTYLFARSVLSSSKFSWFIVILFILQASWVAWTFKWIIFDESFHFGIISIYTDHLWPVIYNQPAEYDKFRDFAGEGSKLYHFLMSFPFRLIQLITPEQIEQLRLLRFINIGMGVIGLVWFFKLFKQLGVARLHANMAMFIFIMLPIVPWLGGSINYDNFIFMLSPIYLYLTIRLLHAKKIAVRDIVMFLTIGLVACLAKFTFLPVFFLATAVVLYKMIRNRSNVSTKNLLGSGLLQKTLHSLLYLGFGLVAVLFIQTYVVNFIQYGTPRPVCQETLGKERCLDNAVIQRNEMLLRTLDQRSEADPALFTHEWGEQMQKTLFYSSKNPGEGNQPPLPYLNVTFLLLFLIGAVTLMGTLMYKRSLIKGLLFPLAIAGFYILIVLIEHYLLYRKYNLELAIQGRYLLFVMPVIITAMVITTSYLISSLTRLEKVYKTILLCVLLIGLTQGGGLMTHLVRGSDDWYWAGSSGQRINSVLHSILHKTIIEKPL